MNHLCFFVSDLHGSIRRYRTLFQTMAEERPSIVFLGGDLLPSYGFISEETCEDFVLDFLGKELANLKVRLGASYPEIFLILGNDDPRAEEGSILELEKDGLCSYIHDRKIDVQGFSIYGYAFVPPTPFLLKDWEKYDVSRSVDPGCVDLFEGRRSVPVSEVALKQATIQKDLLKLAEGSDLSRSVFLFHTPPYNTKLDYAALDGVKIEHVAVDVHIGSIAVRRFIESQQPWLTLHGHVHESARMTGSWRDQIGRTHMFTSAHDGPELALVRFELQAPESATRELL